MPKITKHPKLRTAIRKNKAGKATPYYYFDMRGTGEKDIPLGSDWAVALAKWDELYHKRPRVDGTLEEAFQLFEFKKMGVGERDGKPAPPAEYKGETHRMYSKAIRLMRPIFGRSTWEAVTLKHLMTYMEKREGKVQANREVSALQVIWNFARMNDLTKVVWPAAGLKSAGWKNKESAREFEVTDEMFAAIYEQADQLLRDAMDISSATAMRVTDVYTVPLPPGDVLHLKSNKKGRKSDFDLSLSAVLPDLIRRRRANKVAEHLMLLAGPFKRPVSYWMLQSRYEKARAAAAKKAREAGDEELAQAVEAMFLRDCRKYASDLAQSLEEASKLLQHGDTATTRRHYRTKVDKIKPVR